MFTDWVEHSLQLIEVGSTRVSYSKERAESCDSISHVLSITLHSEVWVASAPQSRSPRTHIVTMDVVILKSPTTAEANGIECPIDRRLCADRRQAYTY